MGAGERLYRLLLRAYPRRFRESYAGDMADVFRDAWRDARRGAGLVGRARFWAETGSDVLVGMALAWAGAAAGRLGLPGHTDPPDPYHPGRRHGTLVDTASGILQDVRFALRSFARRPGFTAVAVATLSLGIGGVTAIFSVVHGVLLTPLPYEDPGRLVRIWYNAQNPESGWAGNTHYATSGAQYHAWRRESRTLDRLVAFAISEAPLGPEGTFTLPATYGSVTWDFFQLLGVRPRLGRLFVPEDEPADGQARVMILSHGYWRQAFGADPDILGRTVIMNGEPRTVVGVLPAGFRWLESPDRVAAWIPRHLRPADVEVFFHQALGRVRPGYDLADVREDLGRPVAAMAESHGWGWADRPVADWVTVEGYHEALFGDVRSGILLLLGAVGFLLLLACVNLANLLLGQAASRSRELAIRGSLGAGRSRLVVQLLAEALVLAVAGGVAGLAVAAAGVEVLQRLAPDGIPRMGEVGLDASVLAASAVVTLASGVLFGLLPAWRGSRPDIRDAMKDGGSGRGAGFRRSPLRGALVVGEVALALVVLSGAGLMIHSFVNLLREDLGFRTRGVWTADLRVPGGMPYFEDTGIGLPRVDGSWVVQTADWRSVHHRLLDRLRRDPRIADAAAAQEIPLSGSYGGSTRFTPEGWEAREPGPADDWGHSQNFVEPGFFRLLDVPLLEGRLLTEADEAPGAAPVAVVNRALAERFWPGEEVLGKRFLGWNPTPDSTAWIDERLLVEIVGVVGRVQEWEYGEDPYPAIYWPRGATADTVPYFNRRPGLALFVEPAPGSESAVQDAVIGAIQDVDPTLAFLGLKPLGEITGSWLREPRFYTLLLAAFGTLGALLAAVGIAGVIATLVAGRTREIGIRVALGARPGVVVRMLVAEILGLAALGLVLGTGGALALTGSLAAHLHRLTARDPATLASAALLMGAVALVAAWLPARRATGVHPVEALRTE